MAGVEGLMNILAGRGGCYDRVSRLFLMNSGIRKQVIRGHEDIIKLIGSRNPEKSIESARAHIGKSLATAEQIRRKYPSYFFE